MGGKKSEKRAKLNCLKFAKIPANKKVTKNLKSTDQKGVPKAIKA